MTNKKSKVLCPICNRGSTYFDFGKDKNDIKFDIYKCTFCGHGFYHPGVKSKKDLLEYYNEEYAKSYNPEIENEEFMLRKQQYAKDVNMLSKFFNRLDIKVLDFGCSTGQFLLQMPEEWDKSGYEINKFEIDFIRKNYPKLKVFDSLDNLKTLKENKEKFDLVTFRGVIEHFFDFDEIFTLLSSLVNKSGNVFVCATPDFNSPCAQLYKSKWNQIVTPIHYHQFTSASLSLLFAKYGFSLKSLRHPYLDTPYENFAEDSRKYLKNVKNVIDGKEVEETIHAFPGNMMSMMFEKLE